MARSAKGRLKLAVQRIATEGIWAANLMEYLSDCCSPNERKVERCWILATVAMGALLFQFYQIFAVTSGWGSVVQTLASASVGVFYRSDFVTQHSGCRTKPRFLLPLVNAAGS